MRVWEDAAVGQRHEASAVVSAEDLAAFCRLTGEDHALHVRNKVVPGSMLQSVASGVLGRGKPPWDLVGLREARWTFRRPVLAGQQWRVVEEIVDVESLTCVLGTVTLRRTLTTDAPCATGVLTLVVRRRS